MVIRRKREGWNGKEEEGFYSSRESSFEAGLVLKRIVFGVHVAAI